MSERRTALDWISRALGNREVIWGGLRADDAEAVSDLRELAGSFSIIGGYDRGGAVPSITDYEDLSGVRQDLETWDIEDHLATEPAKEFRKRLLNQLARPTALLPYRSSQFLSSLVFARREHCINLGLFGTHQSLFEFKPWVETQVSALGIEGLPWIYVADEEQFIAERLLDAGPIVLRVSRSSGGAGLALVKDPGALTRLWPHRPEAFVAVAPYLGNTVPVNVGATVWQDGITMTHPSIQLIGIRECVDRDFGYCGNDFGLAGELDGAVLDAIEERVVQLGRWLRCYGYRGTFGVDFLVRDGVPLFTEINARFQGSTHASSQLSSEEGQSCVVLDHIAAILGRPAPRRPSLREFARRVGKFAHIVLHRTTSTAESVDPYFGLGTTPASSVRRVDVVAKPNVRAQVGAIVARVTVADRVTSTGYALSSRWATLVERAVRRVPYSRSPVPTQRQEST